MSLTTKSLIESAMVPPAMVDENDNVAIIAKVLLQSNKSCVFVTSIGEVIGIITERDVLRLILREGGMLSPDIKAKDFMIKPVVTIPKTATLAQADDLMEQTNVSRLAVVEKEDSLIVVGLIDADVIRSSIKIELLKTLKKRQKFMQDK
ncbi:MAG: CBS domain-containing protein [Candidatus Heimdallarchaeota archaeon]|nr:CBS domain-containing protein [Candidatus Heimdallarchaeota archaeon]MBY8995754.1 CBS domain-containing protein [Candidatus Heimdallarchaeota archaeon]